MTEPSRARCAGPPMRRPRQRGTMRAASSTRMKALTNGDRPSAKRPTRVAAGSSATIASIGDPDVSMLDSQGRKPLAMASPTPAAVTAARPQTEPRRSRSGRGAMPGAIGRARRPSNHTGAATTRPHRNASSARAGVPLGPGHRRREHGGRCHAHRYLVEPRPGERGGQGLRVDRGPSAVAGHGERGPVAADACRHHRGRHHLAVEEQRDLVACYLAGPVGESLSGLRVHLDHDLWPARRGVEVDGCALDVVSSDDRPIDHEVAAPRRELRIRGRVAVHRLEHEALPGRRGERSVRRARSPRGSPRSPRGRRPGGSNPCICLWPPSGSSCSQ